MHFTRCIASSLPPMQSPRAWLQVCERFSLCGASFYLVKSRSCDLQSQGCWLATVRHACRGLRAHPHVVTLHDIFLTRNFLVMSMEMAHGTLKGLLDMARRRGVARLDVDLSRFFFQQIILTVKYCHEKGIIIRDLKPANLLVTWGPNGPSRLQLCDFGWAKIIADLVRCFSTQSCICTPRFDSLHVAYLNFLMLG